MASVALTDSSPFWGGACQIQSPPPPPGSHAVCHHVSAGFFETLGLRVVRGRPFLASDRAGAPPVAVVSQSFADKYFPNQEPLGQHIQTNSGAFFDVVGVSADIENRDRPGLFPLFAVAYILSGQDKAASATPLIVSTPLARMDVLVRSNGDPAQVKAEVRQAVRALDSSLWASIQTIDEYLARYTGSARGAILAMGLLGGLVLLMASVGIYALLAYSVSQRTREIGIRMALGARNREILGLVMRRTLILIAWGIALGLIGAMALGRILTALIPGDPSA